MAHRCLSIFVVLAILGARPDAQNSSTLPELSFEVTSVKPSPNDLVPEGISVFPDGSARFTRFQVRTLITMAYRSEGLQRFDQLIGAPQWVSVDRFDIEGKAGVGSGSQSGPSQVPAMLRSVLRERFRLRVHSETREMPAYGLVVARVDGRLGPGLRESNIVCPAIDAARPNPDPDACRIRASAGVIIGRGASTEQLAGNLSGYLEVDRFVTDRTGLTGRYDFTLEYSRGLPQDAGATTGPGLFTALVEQLGLRLQPERKTVPVLVIDNVEKPTPN
jgi:uncharacterized protein (TIGR03435 family)